MARFGNNAFQSVFAVISYAGVTGLIGYAIVNLLVNGLA